MAGINLGKRVLTAGILLPSVGLIASTPIGWILLNICIYLLFLFFIVAPLLMIIEYSTIMEKIL